MIAMLMHLSRRGAPLALCLALVLIAPVVQAESRRTTAPPVKAANLPTWAEVDAIYDGFEDGSRETFAYREVGVLKGDCSTHDAAPRPDAGRDAFYFGASGSIPADLGYEHPFVFTMSFATVEAAKKAFQAQRSWIKACDRRTVHVPQETDAYRKAALSGLGEQRLAYRHSLVLKPKSDDPLFINTLVFWIRNGRFLVDVEVRKEIEGQTPAKAPLVTLAEIALARLH